MPLWRSGAGRTPLEAAARRDIETFTLLAELDWDQVLAEVGGKAPREYGPVLANLPRWRGSSPFSFAELTEFYRPTARGSLPGTGLSCGKMGRSARWSNPTVPARTRCWAMSSSGTGSSPIPGPCWRANLVNNVLLYGDSGTGKSATVKNLLTLPGFEALRLIEVQKEGLADLPRLIRTLGGRRLKFILFIDDLPLIRTTRPTPPQDHPGGRLRARPPTWQSMPPPTPAAGAADLL